MTEQAESGGRRRWYVHVAAGLSPQDTNLRKTLWASTALKAGARAERLGYTVVKIEPAPPAQLPGDSA